MLGRLVAKLLFKACVPLVALAGVMSYGIYLKGGDPGNLWGQIGSGMFGQATKLLSGAKDNMAGVAGQLSDSVSSATDPDRKSSLTQVFTWKDADGVTHFGTSAPAGSNAQLMQVDPSVNVLAPVSAPVSIVQRQAGGQRAAGMRQPSGSLELLETTQDSIRERSSDSVRELESELGGPLPGVAGQILSSGGGNDGGIDPSQLIRLLQSAGK